MSYPKTPDEVNNWLKEHKDKLLSEAKKGKKISNRVIKSYQLWIDSQQIKDEDVSGPALLYLSNSIKDWIDEKDPKPKRGNKWIRKQKREEARRVHKNMKRISDDPLLGFE